MSTVLLPPVIQTDELRRTYMPHMVMSSKTLNMTELQNKSKAKDEIEIRNEGKAVLEISKVQLFTAGLQVQLGKQRLEPGESTRLKVTAIGKELKNSSAHGFLVDGFDFTYEVFHFSFPPRSSLQI